MHEQMRSQKQLQEDHDTDVPRQPKKTVLRQPEVLEDRIAPIYFGQRFGFGTSFAGNIRPADHITFNRCETLVGEGT